ncbi:MAG: hypothetical protein AAF658_20230, partial [Myxococcota bacterium]
PATPAPAPDAEIAAPLHARVPQDGFDPAAPQTTVGDAPPDLVIRDTRSDSEATLVRQLNDPEDRADYITLRNSPPFRALGAELRDEVYAELADDPDLLADVAEWTSSPHFNALDDHAQAEFFQMFLTGGLRVAGSLGAQIGMSPVPTSGVPAEISVIFPGQRADAGGGELNDTMRRARQLRRLFPEATINVVLFDPPQSITTGIPREIRERPYRVTEYIQRLPEWPASAGGAWNFGENPVVPPEDPSGFRFVYATRATDSSGQPVPFDRANPTASESYRFSSYNSGGPVEFTPSERASGMLLGMRPGDNSIGARYVSQSDLAIVGGAGSPNDPRVWSLDLPNSPRGRVNVNFYEADHQLRSMGTTLDFQTTLTHPDIGVYSEHVSTDIETMRGLVDQYGIGQTEARRALLQGL